MSNGETKGSCTFLGIVAVVVDGAATEVFGFYAGEELGVYSGSRFAKALFS